jgi:hypothetical protein
MTKILNSQVISPFLLVASGLGATVEYLRNSNKPRNERIVNFLIGFLVAVFMTPVVANYIGVVDENQIGGIAFLLGNLGTNALDLLKNWLKNSYNK